MAGAGIGGGIAAAAFWAFVAVIIVAGIWDSARKRETQHETLRRMLDKSDALDQQLLDKMISQMNGQNRLDRDLGLAGVLTTLIAPGIAILGWFIAMIAPQAWFPLVGVAGLVFFVGLSLLVASRLVARWHRDDSASVLK